MVGLSYVSFSKSTLAGSTPQVTTQQGVLEGVHDGKSFSFKGIRYAQAGRFMPPEPPESWSGVREAKAFGASAPQTNASPPPGPPYVILAQLPRPANAPPPTPLPESEDCQFLNIWTGSLDRAAKKPVMVWLHGGFFYGGNGSTVDGSALAGDGSAVVVSLNHRLNAFGFTDLRDYGAEFSHSGNVGMLDIIAALRWIRENIEAFGGDPERVMVFGTSGGGMKTAFLMASPAARGLFHRAAAQSGPGLRMMEPDQARRATAMLFREVGLAEGNVTGLQALSTAELLAGYHAVAAKMKPERFIDLPCFAPVLHPELLPAHPFSPEAAPLTRDYPMIMGWNAQEMSFFMGNDPEGFELDAAGLEARAADLLGDVAPAALDIYRRSLPDASPSRQWIQMHSDFAIMLPTIAQANRRVEAGSAPSWVYRLDWQSPALGGKLGALHTMEGSLLFNTPAAGKALLGEGPQVDALATQMSSAWVSLASTGDPNTAATGLPHWPQWDAANEPVMAFGAAPAVENHPAEEARAAMAALLAS